MQTNTRVVAYLRVSTESQTEGGVSLEAQRRKVLAYAELYEVEVVAVIEDAGVSAKSLSRPGLNRALGLLETGEAQGLLVAKLDRLTRSVRDLGSLLDSGFRDRYALLSVAEQVDTRSAAGRLVLNVLASVAEWERETIGERTREALQHLKAEGVRLGGEALGWKRTKATDESGRRIVRQVEEECAAVERVLALRAQGLSLRAIAEALTQEEIRTKRGGAWHPQTVSRVLRRAADSAA